MRPALVIIIAYLLGSIPFGYLIVRATQGSDIRQTGSGGTGATNVSRRAGKTAGVITLVLDALKGAMAVLTAKVLLGLPAFGPASTTSSVESGDWLVAAAAVAVIAGHIFPVWLRFRGGKGVATGVGVFLMLAPIAVVLAGVIFIFVVWRTRYVSFGSIVAAVTIPLLLLLQNYMRPIVGFVPVITAATAAGALIIFAHRANIGRMAAGTESRFK
jgi:glycerol-3-phosphate acyltransferase PlsY